MLLRLEVGASTMPLSWDFKLSLLIQFPPRRKRGSFCLTLRKRTLDIPALFQPHYLSSSRKGVTDNLCAAQSSWGVLQGSQLQAEPSTRRPGSSRGQQVPASP